MTLSLFSRELLTKGIAAAAMLGGGFGALRALAQDASSGVLSLARKDVHTPSLTTPTCTITNQERHRAARH